MKRAIKFNVSESPSYYCCDFAGNFILMTNEMPRYSNFEALRNKIYALTLKHRKLDMKFTSISIKQQFLLVKIEKRKFNSGVITLNKSTIS